MAPNMYADIVDKWSPENTMDGSDQHSACRPRCGWWHRGRLELYSVMCVSGLASSASPGGRLGLRHGPATARLLVWE